MTHLKAGDPAPHFEGYDQNGNLVSMDDFKDQKLVLYFYPKAMTPGCTVQACSLRDSAAELRELDVVVLAVSPDPVKRLQKFAERDQLDFTLLSDTDHAVAEQYGSWGLKKFMGREYMGVLRNTFIIDKKGVLREVMEKVKTKTHHQDAMDWIRENL